jgi:chemotaxis protein MotB
MKKTFLFLLGSCIALSGCVKKSEYETLKHRFEDASSDLETASKKAKSLEEALAEEEAKVKELQSQLDETSGRLAATEATLAEERERGDKLQNELTEVVSDRARLKSSAEELKRALAELAERKAAAEKRVAQFRNLLKRFQSLIDAGKLKVRIIDGRMVLVLPTDILFDSGSAKLSEEGLAAITEVAKILATMKERQFQVGGHTDNVPIKTSSYRNNWELAADRALGVAEAMIAAGVSGKSLSAASYGEFQPVATNKTPEGKAANRRIDIVIVPDLSDLPGFKELQNAVESK